MPMSPNAFKWIKVTQRRIFFIVGLWLLFSSSVELSQAATENPENPSDFEIIFTGTGSEKTHLFTVEDGWKIQWQTESSRFRLSAHGSARRLYESPMNEREKVVRWFEVLEPIVLANTTKKHGTAFHPLGGTFYLKIMANGPWSIHLKTIKDTKDYLDVPYTGAP